MNSPLAALIVEDLGFWQDALSEILNDAGYRVWVTSSHAEALDALTSSKFHLAVIDPVLDDRNRRNRDGLRVLQHILEQHPQVCTLVVTASDPNRIEREVGQISNNTPLLYKDKWDDDQFLAVIQELIKQRGLEQCPTPVS